MSRSRDEQAKTNGLNETEWHCILAAERRRLALNLLSSRTGPVELEELARAITAREADAATPSSDTIERVALTLHHQHLPMLSELGTIDYDPSLRRIESIDVTTLL